MSLVKVQFRWVVGLALLGLVAAPQARAEEPILEFLAGLQKNGYGEAALDYIDKLSTRKDIPVAVRQVLDLERSKSLRAAAGEAYNLEQKNQRIAEADKLLEKFIKEFPDHPAAAQSLLTQANALLEKAQMSMGQSRATRDEAEKKELNKQAREQFSEAATQLKQIQGKLKERVDALPPVPANGKPTAARQDLEYSLLETKFKLALVEYSTALTYSDVKDPARKKILQQAGKLFDEVFQQHRGTRAGLLAHMWHGKVLEELGDEVTALETFDEVLVISPEKGNASLEDAQLFAQAQLFRLQLLIKTGDLMEMQNEATEWLKANKAWEKTAPYQGIALTLAKSHIEAAAKPGSVDPRKRYQAAAQILLGVTKVESEYKHEALLLRRECQEKLGAAGGAVTADEELALGDAAAAEKEWADATAAYERAVAIAEQTKNAKVLGEAKSRLTQIRYQLAVQQFTKKEYKEALGAAGKIVGEAPNDPVAIQASGLAIAAALELYAAATPEAKPDALGRLERIANFTMEHWPDRAEADDARMALARASLIKKDEEGALAMLSKVNAQSPRYGTAQQVVGQLHWKRYLGLKKQVAALTTAAAASELTPEKTDELKKQQEQLVALRSQSRKSFKESLLSLKQVAASDPERVDASAIFDAQLLAAESALEDQAAAEAAPWFMELVKQIEAKKPAEVDNNINRAFIGAVRANLGIDNAAVAGACALSLVELSPDAAQNNNILVDFAKLMTVETKKAEAALTEIMAEARLDLDRRKPAEALLAANQKVLGEMVTKLSERKELSIPALVYLGDTAVNLRLSDLANSNYQRALKRIEKPEPGDDVATYAKASTRIRSQLISILRSEGKFEEANKQVDALIAAHPNSLEPKMEKGRILQSWAEKDPTKFDACVAHWTNIRVLLGRVKQRPPEYYEVLYNVALCLLKQSLANQDPSKAVEGEKVLKSTMVLTPSLNGPETVANYKVLLGKLDAASKLPAGKPTTAKKSDATTPATTPKKAGTTPATTPVGNKTTPTTTPPASGGTKPPATGTTKPPAAATNSTTNSTTKPAATSPKPATGGNTATTKPPAAGTGAAKPPAAGTGSTTKPAASKTKPKAKTDK